MKMNVEEIEDLSKMKVADLKKHLKSKGLPVNGNKTELVERLQEALSSESVNPCFTEENPSLESSGIAEEDEFDEEEILGGEDLDNIGKITQEEEAAALAGSIRVKDDALLTEKKKISLKRSEPCLSFPSESSSVAEEKTTKAETAETTDSTANKENSETPTDEPKHKVIKLSGASTDNALEARAKKFGVATTTTDEGRKEARAARFGTANSTTNGTTSKRAPKLSTETGGTDIEKLRKRAERFGEVTSKSLTKLQSLEKLKERQSRFGSTDSEPEKSKDSDSETAKGAKGETEAKVPITAPGSGDEEEKKQKRALKFA